MITGLNQPVVKTVLIRFLFLPKQKPITPTRLRHLHVLNARRGRARRLQRSRNPPLIHEKSWSSWGQRRRKGGWWAASGNQGWASTWLRPPPAPLISEIKSLKSSGQTGTFSSFHMSSENQRLVKLNARIQESARELFKGNLNEEARTVPQSSTLLSTSLIGSVCKRPDGGCVM